MATVRISCDKDEVYTHMPQIADEPSYSGQMLYDVDADLMNAYLAAKRLADFLRKQIVLVVQPQDK